MKSFGINYGRVRHPAFATQFSGAKQVAAVPFPPNPALRDALARGNLKEQPAAGPDVAWVAGQLARALAQAR